MSAFPLVKVANIKANQIVMHKRHPHLVNFVERGLNGEDSTLFLTDTFGTVVEVRKHGEDNVKLLNTWSYSDWCAYVLL